MLEPAVADRPITHDCVTEVTVETIEHPAVTETVEGHWTDLQWHVWTGGPWESDEDPPVDHDGWHPTNGDPQSENHSVPPRVPNDPYFVSHGNSGNGDWFLWTGTWVEEHTVVVEEAWTETIEHETTSCEKKNPPVQPPNQLVITNVPPVIDKAPPTSDAPKRKGAAPVPTVVEAGI